MFRQLSLRRQWASWSRWLTPGIGVKRWLIMLAFGALVAGTGVASLLIVLRRQSAFAAELYYFLTLQFMPGWFRILVPLLIGGLFIFLAILRLGSNLVAPFRRPGEGVAESLHSFSQRNRGPRVVAIGGGTGLPSLLRGLTQYTSNITAVITVADDGGSSGRLRRELGVLPPGDFRNNIAALARDEALMTELLQYRFGGRPAANDDGAERFELQGHAFGNLLLAALAGITGGFDEALVAAGRVLAMHGRVLPSTLENVTLVARVATGANATPMRVVGESAIPKAGGRIQRVSLEPAEVRAYPPALKDILRADVVIIGPGSLYTSILPNLLVPDLASALQRTRALRIYVCNLATQPGETDNYTVADHVSAMEQHMTGRQSEGRRWLDLVLANDNLAIPPNTGGGETVFVRPLKPEGTRLVAADLVDEKQPWRHDSTKLARAIMDFVVRR
jgi:uncharacterized cofD-like protein